MLEDKLLYQMRKLKPKGVYLDNGQNITSARVKLVIRLVIPLFFSYINFLNSQ